MGSYSCWISVGILLCQVAVILAVTPCDPNQRAMDLGACLAKIKEGVADKDRFWFGTPYSQNCPMGPVSMECLNQNFQRNDSIETRLFPNGIDKSLITKYLKVNYMSAQGSYNACGTTFYKTSWQGEIIPTTTEIHRPWYLRNAPMMTWDAAADEMYTVVFYDVGTFILHDLVVNVPGNNVSAGEVIKVYNGPKRAFANTNVYAFFLYKQTGQVTVSEATRDKILNPSMVPGQYFSVPQFAEDHSLTGPVAINWLEATGDEYAAAYMERMRILYACPIYVGHEMDMKPRPFLPLPSHLSVGVNVDFVNAPIKYTVCCKTTSLERSEFSLDPFKSDPYNTALVRSDNSPTITFRKVGMYSDSANFTGDMHTLLVIDPDVPSPTAGLPDKPILHMAVVNILNGDINTGDVVQSYRGPSPPDNLPHWYYFLLYKQEMEVNSTKMPSYAGDSCSGSLQGRCLYDINTAVQEQKLSLVGANWMRAVNDDYVIFRRLNTSDPVAVNATCFGRPSYEDPCPEAVSTGAVTLTSYVLLFVMTTFFMAVL